MAEAPPGAVREVRPERGSLLPFLALTFLVTWICFIAAVALSRTLEPGAELGIGIRALVLAGTFAPGMVAVALTHRARGRAGLRALLAPILRWEVGARWYVFALFYVIVIKLVAALVHRIALGEWPRFTDFPWPLLLAGAVFSTAIGGQTGEEVGWRGYALPRLAARLGLGLASVVLGVIWAVWHLPLFWLRGADTLGQSFPVYLAQVVAFSVAIAWLWWRTGGSLLLAMLLHAAINNTKDIVPAIPRMPESPFTVYSSPIGWIALALLWAAALGFLFDMRRARLAPAESGMPEPARPGPASATAR